MSLACGTYLLILNILVSVLSFLCSLKMTIGCLKNLRSEITLIQLILGIALSDLIYSFCNILSLTHGPSKGTICSIEAIARQISFNYSLLFAVTIAIFCLRSFQIPYPCQFSYLKGALIIGFLTGLATTLPIIWLEKYLTVTNNGLWCLISYNEESSLTNPEKVLVRTIYEAIPDGIYILLSIICFMGILPRLFNRIGREGHENLQIVGYTAVMCLILLPRLIDNDFRIMNPNCENPWIIVFHICLTHSAGTLNAIVYGWKKIICLRRRRREDPFLERFRE